MTHINEDDFVAQLCSDHVDFTSFVLNGDDEGFYDHLIDFEHDSEVFKDVYINDFNVYLPKGVLFRIVLKPKFRGLGSDVLHKHRLIDLYEFVISRP